jgi:hypothetical protein
MSRWHARLAELRALRSAAPAPVQNVQIVQNAIPIPTFERFEQIEQRTGPINPAAILGGADKGARITDGDAPRKWAEALERLDPNNPPGDVPPRRWLQFIGDSGRFLDAKWAARAVALGWGPLDLFGCCREQPFARVDYMGLLWLLNGGTIADLHRDRAVIKTQGGSRQTYRRRPVEVGQVVLAWELCA